MDFPIVLKRHSKNSGSNLRRIVTKRGHLNMQAIHVPYYKYFRFTKDFANTLVSLRWRWVTLIIILVNIFFYVTFAGIWMLDAWISGDFNKTGNFCIVHSQHFTGYLLLSIETITTTGYGYLYPTESCHLVLITFTASTIVMILLDGAFISIVFLKIVKPLANDSSLFSRRCVICLRDSKLCLVFRIYDHLNKHALEPTVSVYLINKSNLNNCDMKIIEIELQSTGLFLWPTEIVHEIDGNSPFWEMCAGDFINTRFELCVTFSGTSTITDQFSTSLTSYVNEEILWGYRFKPCMEFNEKLQSYVVHRRDTFKITPCDTPLCSAKTLKNLEQTLSRYQE